VSIKINDLGLLNLGYMQNYAQQNGKFYALSYKRRLSEGRVVLTLVHLRSHKTPSNQKSAA
jgi:hypothetical protein